MTTRPIPVVPTERAREILTRPDAYATLATILPSGLPHQAVLWFALRGDAILVNGRSGRVWTENLLRDARFSLMVEQGVDWVSAVGVAEAVTDRERAIEDIVSLAHAYHADDPETAARAEASFRRQDRISFLLHPERIIERRI